MGKNILVAVIGAGGAFDTPYAIFKPGKDNGKYSLEGEEKSSSYPFMAAGELLKEAFDTVILIGTKKSRWGLLCNKVAVECKKKGEGEPYCYDGLAVPAPTSEEMEITEERKKVELFLEKCMKKKAEIFVIDEGRTKEETDGNIEQLTGAFSGIFQDIDGEIKITLDVSNGLRSIPMYVQAIIDYFLALESRKHKCIVEIVYGMYDAKYKFGKDNAEIAPMVQMNAITEIRRWTSAVREFYANGSVKQLMDLLDQNGAEEYRKAFSDFSFAMNSNNLGLFSTSIQEMQKLLQEDREAPQSGLPIYIRKVLRSVLEDLTERFKSDEKNGIQEKYSSYMFSIAQWYFDQERFGDAVIALQEGMITYVMERYPEKCDYLLKKNYLDWHKEYPKISKKLFDINVRKVIRENIFERKDEEVEYEDGKKEQMDAWKKWREEYDYVCKNIRNSAMLLPYKDQDTDGKEGMGEDGISIEVAREKIANLIAKMEKERSDDIPENNKMLAMRLDYLLGINEYDVFISYRRSYNQDQENDGFLLAVTIKDYLEEKGLKVYMDVQCMEGESGEFSPLLRKSLFNSKCCLVILGNRAYQRECTEEDEYYKEIITAEKGKKKIFVACMKGFDDSLAEAGKGVLEQKELKKVAKGYQRIGSPDTTEWEYSRVLKLREKIEEEINMFLYKGKEKLKGSFVNYSNHPSSFWSQKQLETAQCYGDVIDMPFPDISPDLSEEDIEKLAGEEVKGILSQNPSCVLCQGEFTFTYRIISQLKANHVKVVAACSERKAIEKVENGKTIKMAEFEFRGFREY